MSYLAAIAQTRKAGQQPATAPSPVARPPAQNWQDNSPPSGIPPSSHIAQAAPLPAAMTDARAHSAAFFVKLRQYLGLSLEQAAYVLETQPAVVAALEAGAIAALPSWPQTHRIVSQYASLAGIDPGPALHCLESCFQAAAPPPTAPYLSPLPPFLQNAPSPAPAPTGAAVATLPEYGEADDDDDEDDGAGLDGAQPTLMQRLAGWMPGPGLLVRIAAIIVVLAVAGLFTPNASLQAAMTKLPAPVGSLWRDAREAILLRTSGKFDGMVWIDVSDPRSRKADKLPVKQAPRARPAKN